MAILHNDEVYKSFTQFFSKNCGLRAEPKTFSTENGTLLPCKCIFEGEFVHTFLSIVFFDTLKIIFNCV